MGDPARVDVVVLCGGLGTRLGAMAADRPKPMALIGRGHTPFLAILLDAVARHGFRRFVLCVGHKADIIREYFRREREKDRTVVFSEEPEPLGTAGALKQCEPCVESGVFLVMNGDSLCPLDFASLLDFHERHGGIGSVAAVSAAGRTDGGFLEIGDGDRVAAFSEKKVHGRARYLSAGIYVFNRTVFDVIPPNRRCSLEHEVLPLLLEAGLYAYTTSEPLYDIGTPERLEAFRRLGRGSQEEGGSGEGKVS